MPEVGGPSTQAGIFFQNTVAALALADLLELAPVPPRERVVEVRVEAPTHVDDVVLTYADGHHVFQNVKISLKPGTPAWTGVWTSLVTQFNSPSFRPEDELLIVLGEWTPSAKSLRDTIERARTAVDRTEWLLRLSNDHHALVTQIDQALGSSDLTLELLRRLSVVARTEEQIQDDFNRRRLGGQFCLPAALLSTLRDIAGAGSPKRALFMAAPLRRRLAEEYGILITEPLEWGLPAYRAAVRQLARIHVPGTHISGSAEELYVWPRVKPYDRGRPADFEEEQMLGLAEHDEAVLDLQAFPSDSLDRCIVVAGPGFGKSALLACIAGRLAKGPSVPAVIPLASMAMADVGVTEFLAQEINREFSVRPDWQRLAEQGLITLLFDGLDEVPGAARPKLLSRIRTFSARFPATPWMLTVRDPSILADTFEATLVELLPLSSEQIYELTEKMRWLPAQTGQKLMERLESYPELRQLARIPLFLSILLATLDGAGESLPTSRSGVIEAYLRTLFSPQLHKQQGTREDHSRALRSIAETLAYERLARQEMGASEREVRDVVERHAESPSEASLLFELLQANGILRPQTGVRLQFPFPTVQEYLAACHLVRHYPESLEERIADAIQRPWAQVIQFAIEQHPEPSAFIRAILEREDDAFGTGLRHDVGDRLVQFWEGTTYAPRDRVGRIIADGFSSSPISEVLRIALHKHWLMHSGAGEIISNLHDRDLTTGVVHSLLRRSADGFPHYHSLRPAIAELGDDALSMIIARVLECERGTASEEWAVGFAGNLTQGRISIEAALRVATDLEIPLDLRLRADYLAGAPIGAEALDLVRQALRDEHADRTWSALRALSLYPQWVTELSSVMRDSSIPMVRRREIAGHVTSVFPEQDMQLRSRSIQSLLLVPDIDEELLDIFRLVAARYGDRVIFESLVARLEHTPTDIAATTLSLFGHYRDRKLAETAADNIRTRVNGGNAEDAVRLARGAALGMTYVFEMDFGLGGLLRSAPPHPATDLWRELVNEWAVRADLTLLQRAHILTREGLNNSKTRAI